MTIINQKDNLKDIKPFFMTLPLGLKIKIILLDKKVYTKNNLRYLYNK